MLILAVVNGKYLYVEMLVYVLYDKACNIGNIGIFVNGCMGNKNL